MNIYVLYRMLVRVYIADKRRLTWAECVLKAQRMSRCATSAPPSPYVEPSDEKAASCFFELLMFFTMGFLKE